ncbi:Serine/threonine protein kinase [Actinoplanes sp. SE50]|uniref:serine/threonine-protein kinase n=1 Tax=unclassified Actinoplanes TaxID=2626549 RepID=UPI00023ED066|nr:MULTISPECIES: serine/threonine-protein kinase [unclassified Actinoplanes]AEV84368.1 Serine/threonine protein kinase [Actinoplanes sp. SE50/110]ATO82760.1 Serine/threonine protein kinase [Actinoplanes sp. SE50]SLM00167.1 serine/threonine protein kinase [Actinoplanes sp. SE50/110]
MGPEEDGAAGQQAGDLVVADRYRLLALAGSGGMGRVWRAHDDLLDREVAVKEVLAPAALPYMDRTEILRNTVREARAAARLDHPNVIRVFDVVRAAGRSWIVMEYVPSRSLHDIVTRDGPLTHRHAARIGATLLDALDAAHRAGVLHLDVKPHNVLIAEDGRVVLTDFGLATIVAVPAGRAEPLLGSPHYIAPERLRDGVSSREADLWSLGATLYMAVEGRAPYARPQVAESLAALLHQPPDPPQHPGPLHTVIAGLLTADPKRRLTAGDARPALRDLTRRAVGVHAVPAPRRPADSDVRFRAAAAPAVAALIAEPVAKPAPARWRGLLVAGIATAAVILVAAVAVRIYGGGTGTPPAAAAVASPMDACSTAQSSPVTGSGEDAPVSLPDGWLWHVDADGFALAVPRGWHRGAAGGDVCFRDADGDRSFTVQSAGPLNGRPLQRWQDAERKAPPGYRRVSMGPLLITGGGADWEYSWQPATGPRLHTYRMLLAAGDDRSYALTWTTRDADWDLDRSILRTLTDGFRDSARPAVTWTIPGPRH